MTTKQIRFCEEYVIDWNATRSAIAAGYSEKTAAVIGKENLTKPYIKDYIDQCKNELERLAGVSALRNLTELRNMAYSNLHDLQKNWFTLEEWEDLTKEQKAAISQIKRTTRTDSNGDTIEIIEIKLHDKRQALDSMNKMMGYNSPDKMEVKTNDEDLSEIEAKLFDLESKLEDIHPTLS